METKRLPLSELHPTEDNPRSITDKKFNQLIDSLLVLPKMLELRPIVHDGTGAALGGNMRLRALQAIAAFTPEQLTERLTDLRDFQRKSKAQQKSLLAWWAAWLASPSVPSIAADELTEGEKREFIIKDNASFGEWDWDKLSSDWNTEDLNGWGLDVWDDSVPAEEGEDGGVQVDDGYSTKTNIPQYEPTGKTPTYEEMFDTSKTDELVAEINDAHIPEDVKAFLIEAAHRHTKFNYRNIAEYYANATPEVQELMENSALVIIDIGDAIAKGFTTLEKEIRENEEGGEASE